MGYMNSAEYEEPVAIFTDIMMPFISGHVLIEKIHAKNRHQKVVIMSADPVLAYKFRSGVCMSLQKPVAIRQLDEATRDLLHCHGDPDFKKQSACYTSRNLDFLNISEWRCHHECSGSLDEPDAACRP